MEWVSSKYTLPQSNQEVLIRNKSDIGLATFDSERQAFLLKNGSKIECRNEQVLWVALHPSDNSKVRT